MHEKVWNNCLGIIIDKISEQSYKTWFEPIIPLKLQDKVLTIQVPSQFFYEWLEEHYVHLLRKAIDQELGTGGRLEYSIIVDQGNRDNHPVTINLPTNKHPAYGHDGILTEYISPFAIRGIAESHQYSNLNPQYVFESYIDGDCNRLARSAGMAVAQKPGITSFNPLMIYGGVGLGKTHLVQAIGNSIKQNLDNKFVLYVASEKFTTQFIEALRNNNVQNFTNFYLQVDALILDDVQ
ncbi:MAG: DnaA/Hda family protein, partial [Bacteroidetes bacterium]|nr:DnaA/Hda family protein [Bacteroidota bacterium]